MKDKPSPAAKHLLTIPIGQLADELPTYDYIPLLEEALEFIPEGACGEELDRWALLSGRVYELTQEKPAKEAA